MLLKAEGQAMNVLNLTKKKLITLAYGAECISSKIDNWVSRSNDYKKLQSTRLSRSCQTMTDHPLILKQSSYWKHTDTVLIENWVSDKPEPKLGSNSNNNNSLVKNLQLANRINDHEPSNSSNQSSVSSDKINKVNISKPIIRMDGDLIEVEYYCNEDDDDDYYNIETHDVPNNGCENNCTDFISNEEIAQDFYKTNVSRINDNNQHYAPKIPQRKIAENRGISPKCSPRYKEFLVKADNNNLTSVNESSNNNDENNLLYFNYSDNIWHVNEFEPDEIDYDQFDRHRSLTQTVRKPKESKENDNVMVPQKPPVLFERVGSTRVNKTEDDEIKSDIKSFLSFRCPNRKNRIDKKIRKKYVTSDDNNFGPIWPAVLLTYDKGVLPGTSENNTNDFRIQG